MRRTRSSQTTDNGASPLLSSSSFETQNSRVNGRRSYDRFLATPCGQQQTGHHQPHAHPTTYSHYATANEARRRTANYAWERRRRPPPPGSNPHLHFHRPHPRSQTTSSVNEHPQFRQATASTRHYRPPRADWKETELDRVNRVSGFGRALQLVGLFSVAVALVGAMGKS